MEKKNIQQMLKINGHQVNLRVTAPEKEINSVSITDH